MTMTKYIIFFAYIFYARKYENTIILFCIYTEINVDFQET